MKTKLKYLLIAAVATTSLSGCVKLWEEERCETVPLPEVEIPVTPDPWEPGGTQNSPTDN